jgi:hypothetical protein
MIKDSSLSSCYTLLNYSLLQNVADSSVVCGQERRSIETPQVEAPEGNPKSVLPRHWYT